MRKIDLKGELKTHYLKKEILGSAQVKRRKRKRNKYRARRVQPKTKEEKPTPSLFLPSNLKVIGVGGRGCSIVSEIARKINGKGFIAANTDLQALNQITSQNVTCFQFGKDLTFGLGTGMNPDLGKAAAEKERGGIKKILKGTEFWILISCLGGGTGSGASPVFAQVSKELQNINLGIFTLPFKFEGKRKLEIAKESLGKLKENLNAYIVIENEKLLQVLDKKTLLREALSAINKFIAENLKSLTEMICFPGLINIGFANLKKVFEGKGELGFMNTIEIKEPIPGEEIAKEVLFNPLLSSFPFQRAEKILFNIAGGENLSLEKVNQIASFISNSVSPEAEIRFGIHQNKNYENKIKITLIATAKEKKEEKKTTEKKNLEKHRQKQVKRVELNKREKIALKPIGEIQEEKWKIPAILRYKK